MCAPVSAVSEKCVVTGAPKRTRSRYRMGAPTMSENARLRRRGVTKDEIVVAGLRRFLGVEGGACTRRR